MPRADEHSVDLDCHLAMKMTPSLAPLPRLLKPRLLMVLSMAHGHLLQRAFELFFVVRDAPLRQIREIIDDIPAFHRQSTKRTLNPDEDKRSHGSSQKTVGHFEFKMRFNSAHDECARERENPSSLRTSILQMSWLMKREGASRRI